MTIGKRSSICVYSTSTLNSCNRLKIKLQLTTFLYSISGDFFTNILHLRSTKIQNIKRFYEIFISNFHQTDLDKKGKLMLPMVLILRY